MWTAWQYRKVFDDLYADCDADEQRSLDNRLDQLLDKGNLAKRPVSAPLGDGIFELRGRRSARILFFFGRDQRIIFVVGIHKDGAVPRSALVAAKKARKILLNGKEIERAISQSD